MILTLGTADPESKSSQASTMLRGIMPDADPAADDPQAAQQTIGMATITTALLLMKADEARYSIGNCVLQRGVTTPLRNK